MARIKLPKKQNYMTLRGWLLEHKHLSTEDIARMSGISIAKIREWKVYCDVVDLKEGELLKIWVNYKNYSTAESCVLLGVTRNAFHKALNKYGIDKYRIKKKRIKSIESPIEVPKNKEDFEKLLNKYGVYKISKLSGMSLRRIMVLRNKFGLCGQRDKFTGLGLNNNCDSPGWLKKNYVEERLSLRQCAAIAGVAPNTIRNWLIKYGIVPRPKLKKKNATLQAGIP